MQLDNYCRISLLSSSLPYVNCIANDGKTQDNVPIVIQARLHHSRKQGNIIFLIMREKTQLVQVVCFKKKMLAADYETILRISRESIVRISGKLRKSPFIIETTGNNFEIEADRVHIVSLAADCPIQVEDLNQCGTDLSGRLGRPEVSVANRLDYRYLDLRSNPNQILFKLRGAMEMTIREFLLKRSFIEIHTPKLISTPSESGAQVFPVKYFDREAFLAQSPQLYKQMMINSDFGRVFEIGAVYRAEKSMSHRHLCEFIGLDLEIELKPWNTEGTGSDTAELEKGYNQVFEVIEEMIRWMDKCMNANYNAELGILEKYYQGGRPVIPLHIPVISFKRGAEMLSEAGVKQDPNDDLNHTAEQKLGELVKEQLHSDIFFLDRYPTHIRPFYTKVDPADPMVSLSYDLIFRGQEIASGAQRINDYNELVASMEKHNLTKEHYSHYLDSFKYGSPPHAGIGIGIERLVALYLNIPDVHLTTLLSRDPNRLDP